VGFFAASTLVAYRNDLGISVLLSWLLVVGTPVVFTVLTYGLVRLGYGPKQRVPERPLPPRGQARKGA
jgi:hypothetical protein